MKNYMVDIPFIVSLMCLDIFLMLMVHNQLPLENLKTLNQLVLIYQDNNLSLYQAMIGVLHFLFLA
jgi:hypothetical protein